VIKIVFCVVEIPFAQDPVSVETQLGQAIKTQIGSHQLLRWAITTFRDDKATIEAVVTVEGDPEIYSYPL
jgi:hypothetical protein